MPMYYKEFMYHLLEANTEALENIKKKEYYKVHVLLPRQK